MKILVTGGLGFIGSHTVVELSNKGYECVIVDNLALGSRETFGRMQKISEYPIRCRNINLLDREQLADVFKQNRFDAVIHLNESRAVDESMENPLVRHEDMINSTANLLEEMKKADVKRIIYSSSIPARKDTTSFGWNPYDHTNSIVEEMLYDLSHLDPKWRVSVLKYTTPVGAHSSGMIGDEPGGIPTNLLSSIAMAANGGEVVVDVPGEPSLMGFIHVTDLANAHDKALKYLIRNAGSRTLNVGTGKGYSALEVIHMFEEVNEVKIPYQIVDKYLEDFAMNCIDSSEAENELDWKAERGLREMCEDTWRWEKESKRLLMG
ncbi:NAD-dependent epimerase/dehydratase family protein [Sporosarcina sp. JAI121]|uniref:NAD-dependent epimerase/dehydratase family protein n=1 Tax=Sporosarcina sp. JAI121 TaxID=2723064 RepID=UPI0015CC773D|nr:NAD-dependent epimerase/dehydratase family protein [Sporosarcina sp. JAI121]NYF23741.1 UDP-glucose 4-epimerase [Sporosarcina sp. JAI121]